MATKTALMFAIFGFCMAIGFCAPVEKEQQPDYFGIFLDRNLTFIESSDSATICFRSTFLAEKPDAEYITEKMNPEQMKRIEVWTNKNLQSAAHVEARKRVSQKTAFCSSDFLEYAMVHKLPDGWMNGAPVNDLDSQMILARRYLAQNLPAACDDSHMVKNFIDHVQSTFKLENIQRDGLTSHDLRITVLRCTPLTGKF